MQKLNWQKLKPYIIQITLFFTIGLVGWFGIGTLQNSIQTAKDRIQELKVLMENREHQMNLLPDLREQHEYITKNKNSLNIILTKEKLVDFFPILEGLATESNVKLKITTRDNILLESKVTLPAVVQGKKATADDKKPVDTGDKKLIKKETGILSTLPQPNYVRLTITATGEYKAVIVFLHQMETLPIALDVVGVQIKEQIESERARPTGNPTNPFSPDGTPNLTVALPVEPTQVILDADFDTVIYLKE